MITIHSSSIHFLTTNNSSKINTSCKASYFIEEDKHLCHVYLDVFQNLSIGINQSGDQLWTRVQTKYENLIFIVNQDQEDLY